MIKQMEYFRSLSETREKTIENLTETVGEFRELGKLVTKLIVAVQKISEREDDDVSSSS